LDVESYLIKYAQQVAVFPLYCEVCVILLFEAISVELRGM